MTRRRFLDGMPVAATVVARDFCARYARSTWKPVVVDEVERHFLDNGWRLTSHDDLSSEYRAWYRELLSRIDDRRERIVHEADASWQRYAELLRAIDEGTIGGGIFRAIPA